MSANIIENNISNIFRQRFLSWINFLNAIRIWYVLWPIVLQQSLQSAWLVQFLVMQPWLIDTSSLIYAAYVLIFSTPKLHVMTYIKIWLNVYYFITLFSFYYTWMKSRSICLEFSLTEGTSTPSSDLYLYAKHRIDTEPTILLPYMGRWYIA